MASGLIARLGASFLATLLCGLALVSLAPRAEASRAPSASEARAIRAAALRTLHGRGWRVSRIRVSTVRTADRYAKAAVDNFRTGVGGEMILRRHAGRWRRIFLGTSEFCRAHAPVGVLDDLGFRCGPTLTVEPVVGSAGRARW